MRLLKTLFRWWLSAVAICCVVGLPALALYDRLSPWPPAIEALSAYSGQNRFCVGSGTDSEWTPTASHLSIQRSYILVPRAFASPSVITVISTDHAPAVVSESPGTFWFVIAIYSVALFFCVRLIRGIISTRYAQSTGMT